MATYYYLACREHNSACVAFKNMGLPMFDEPYILSSWLAEHYQCNFKLLHESDVYGEGYVQWTDEMAEILLDIK